MRQEPFAAAASDRLALAWTTDDTRWRCSYELGAWSLETGAFVFQAARPLTAIDEPLAGAYGRYLCEQSIGVDER